MYVATADKYTLDGGCVTPTPQPTFPGDSLDTAVQHAADFCAQATRKECNPGRYWEVTYVFGPDGVYARRDGSFQLIASLEEWAEKGYAFPPKSGADALIKDMADALERANDECTRLRAALAKISTGGGAFIHDPLAFSRGRGAFSRDPLERANNYIESMKRIALDALAQEPQEPQKPQEPTP